MNKFNPSSSNQVKTIVDRNTLRIRELNDQFRSTLDGGVVLLTVGVLDLGSSVGSAILEAVRTYASFSADNDPYGEHDFGQVIVDGHKVFFKIDYYDPKLSVHADDPADSETTERVMTIMLASEY